MKSKIRIIFPAALTLILAGCTGHGVDPVSNAISSPSASSVASSSSTSSSSSSSSQSSSAAVVADKITLADKIGSYTVGETFNSIFDVSVSLHYSDGSTKDVSAKPAYFKLSITDSTGATVDPTLPFASAGTYSLRATYRSNTSVVSDPVAITVSPALTNAITTKSAATAAFDYVDVENSTGSNLSFPSHSDSAINTLVIPLEMTDFPFSETQHGANFATALNNIFNGDGEKDTGYWESVASYYRKSSMGKLNFNFEIAPTFACGKSSQEVNDLNTSSNASYYTACDMVEAAIANYKKTNGDASTQKFDNDKDGYIDGLWVVYSAPDYGHSSTIGKYSNKDIFWAFCTDKTTNTANLSSPTLHSFGWASQDFMNEGVVAPKVDAHTFIHETGHLLSLTDYYSYDISSATSSGCEGGLAMMDLNIGDQDSFSKMALGWANPYVVTDDCIVTINPNESSGDCVLLADNWNGTVFDEYMLFDLQTPTGLNAQDSTASYSSRPLYFNKPGVRAFHVDARIGKLKYFYAGEESDVTNDGLYWTPAATTNDDYYLTDDQVKTLAAAGSLPRLSEDKTVAVADRTPGYSVINGNCASRCGISATPYKDNRLLTIVTRDSVNCETDLKFASSDSLFQKGDSWDMTRKGSKYFTTVAGKFNNGQALNWVVTVLDVSATSATLQFRKY
jgi:M6 family metalloprotease-like protein